MTYDIKSRLEREIKNVEAQSEEYRVRAAVLKSPAVRRVIHRNPDALIGLIVVARDEIRVNLKSDLGEDEVFETLANSANGDGYVYHERIELLNKQFGNRTLKVLLTLEGFKPFTRAEKKLLRSMGKIQTQRYSDRMLAC